MKLSLCLLLLLPIWTQQKRCLNLDLVILVDTSGSVEGFEKYIADAVSTITSRLENTEARIALYSFNSTVTLHYHLGAINEGFLPITTGGTDLKKAITAATNELFGEYSYSHNRKMIMIISDGDPVDKNGTRDMAEQVRQMGVGILGVIVESPDMDILYMESLCDVFVRTDFTSLVYEIERLDLCL